MPWPSERAWRTLRAMEEDAENDPVGRPSNELDVLLALWDIQESAPGDGFGSRRRHHKDLREFVISYPIRDRLHRETMLKVFRSIRELHERLAQ